MGDSRGSGPSWVLGRLLHDGRTMSKFCGESLPTSGPPGHFESRAFFLGLHCWIFELHSHDCAAPSFELTKSRRNPLSVIAMQSLVLVSRFPVWERRFRIFDPEIAPRSAKRFRKAESYQFCRRRRS